MIMGIFDDKAKELAGDRIAKEQEQKNAQELFLAKERKVNSAMDIFLRNALPNIMREYIAAAEKAHTKSIEIETEGRFGKKKTVAYFAGTEQYDADHGWTNFELYISKQLKCYCSNYTPSGGYDLKYYFENVLFIVCGSHPKYYERPYPRNPLFEYNPLFKIDSIEEILTSLNTNFKEYLLTCL